MSPVDAYWNLCIAFGGQETLTHLTLQGNDQDDMLPPLCEVLRHPKCNLQYLRLASCAATRRQWADLSCCLHINQSLTRLNLTTNKVLDEVAKRRYVTLGHPKCCLQRLSSVLLSPLQHLCCTSRALQRRATSTAGFAGQPAWNLLEMETPGSHFWFPFLVQHLILPSLLFLYDHDRWHTAGRGWGTDAKGWVAEDPRLGRQPRMSASRKILTIFPCVRRLCKLENCQLTEASCKELSSALTVKQRLTHLCLAKNALGDRGVKLLCEDLSYPECQLQTLVLWCCNITGDGCSHLSTLVQQNSNLTHLDLGLNHIGIVGLKFLCEAVKKLLCNLRSLWWWGCALSPFCCADLSSALRSNQNLMTLDPGQNSLGYNGVKMLCDALKHQRCPLKTLSFVTSDNIGEFQSGWKAPIKKTLELYAWTSQSDILCQSWTVKTSDSRLKIDESDAQVQKLLKDTKENNPQLTTESDCGNPKNNRPSSHDFIF